MTDGFNVVIQAISVVGFPIVVSLILMYVVYMQNKNHKDEMNELRKTIENNTIAITQLVDKINTVFSNKN